MRLAELLEALKPSQYRGLVKSWDKSRYADIFRGYSSDKNAYRIYIPMGGRPKKAKPPQAIADAVAEAGYEVEDYATGIASKDGGKRKIKIGKLLKDPKLLKQFAEDPKRGGAKAESYLVVISRHPYDIAGMSTDRGWTSCMNLKNGVNRHWVPLDIKSGTLVAYLVKSDDKNISAPTARVLIKPFVELGGKDIAFGIEKFVYGTDVDGFTKTVKKWADGVNDSNKLEGIFKLHPDAYDDGEHLGMKSALKVVGRKDIAGALTAAELKKFIKKPEALGGRELTEKDKLAIVSENPMALEFIQDPSDTIVNASLRKVGAMIKFVKDPSEEQKMMAVTSQPHAIRDIKDASEAVWIKAIEGRPEVFRDMPNPSEKAKLAAVKAWGANVRYIDNPSGAVQLAAVRQDGTAINYIKNPSEAAVRLAAKMRAAGVVAAQAGANVAAAMRAAAKTK